MIKFLITLIFISLTVFVKGQKMDIPEGVKYLKADKNTNELAKNILLKQIKSNLSTNLFDSVCIVGPSLWDRYSKVEELANIKEGNITLKIKSFDTTLKKEIFENVAAKVIQNKKDFEKLWNRIISDIGKKYTIRKMNRFDILYYWSVIFFDIQEPIFIIEGNTHKILINLNDKFKSFWIDEVL